MATKADGYTKLHRGRELLHEIAAKAGIKKNRVGTVYDMFAQFLLRPLKDGKNAYEMFEDTLGPSLIWERHVRDWASDAFKSDVPNHEKLQKALSLLERFQAGEAVTEEEVRDFIPEPEPEKPVRKAAKKKAKKADDAGAVNIKKAAKEAATATAEVTGNAVMEPEPEEEPAEEPADEEVEMISIEELTKADLKRLAAKNGLESTGNKKSLLKRLKDAGITETEA